MIRRIALLAGLLIVLGFAGKLSADDPIKESPWYPLKVGNKWTYKVKDASFQMQVVKHEKVGDIVCAYIEMSKDGEVKSSEYVGTTADGIYRYAIVGQKPDEPFRILKLPPKAGDTWKVNAKLAGQGISGSFKLQEEEVTVPAGKYKAMLATSEGFEAMDPNGNPVRITFKFWFASNVGLVKQTVQVADRPELVIELEKYEGK